MLNAKEDWLSQRNAASPRIAPILCYNTIMGLGVLDVKGHQVPGKRLSIPCSAHALPDTNIGTVTILEREAEQRQTEHVQSTNTQLKYDTTGASPILLVPQPSDDPADPLNWPLWKRDL